VNWIFHFVLRDLFLHFRQQIDFIFLAELGEEDKNIGQFFFYPVAAERHRAWLLNPIFFAKQYCYADTTSSYGVYVLEFFCGEIAGLLGGLPEEVFSPR